MFKLSLLDPLLKSTQALAKRLYNSPLKILYHRLPVSVKGKISKMASVVFEDGVPIESIPHVYPVLKCNLNCPYCSDGFFYDKSYMGFNSLPVEKWIDILNGIDGDSVIISGGEPTIYKDLPHLITDASCHRSSGAGGTYG